MPPRGRGERAPSARRGGAAPAPAAAPAEASEIDDDDEEEVHSNAEDEEEEEAEEGRDRTIPDDLHLLADEGAPSPCSALPSARACAPSRALLTPTTPQTYARSRQDVLHLPRAHFQQAAQGYPHVLHARVVQKPPATRPDAVAPLHDHRAVGTPR